MIGSCHLCAKKSQRYCMCCEDETCEECFYHISGKLYLCLKCYASLLYTRQSESFFKTEDIPKLLKIGFDLEKVGLNENDKFLFRVKTVPRLILRQFSKNIKKTPLTPYGEIYFWLNPQYGE